MEFRPCAVETPIWVLALSDVDTAGVIAMPFSTALTFSTQVLDAIKQGTDGDVEIQPYDGIY